MSEPKKHRVDADSSATPADIELLTGVSVVICGRPRVQGLNHVTKSLEEFVDYSVKWSLLKAVKTGNTRLVSRVLRSVNISVTDENTLQEWADTERYAAMTGNLPMMLLLTSKRPIRYKREIAFSGAFSGHVPLLQWIQTNDPTAFDNNSVGAGQVAFSIAAERFGEQGITFPW